MRKRNGFAKNKSEEQRSKSPTIMRTTVRGCRRKTFASDCGQPTPVKSRDEPSSNWMRCTTTVCV
jgi:hypothetical protein